MDRRSYPRSRSTRLVPAYLRVLEASLSLLLVLFTERAQAYALPPDAGAIDVTRYGARGDGQHDDTQAVLSAIAAARIETNVGRWPQRIVYFPAGTYLLSRTLSSRSQRGKPHCGLALMGESAQTVTLRLKDHAPGFDRPERPRAVVFTSSALLDGGPTKGGKDYLGKGEGNDAYANYVEDLTVDVGQGNPGAIGIDFLANNFGAVRNVRLAAAPDSGHIGLSMDRKWPGPLLVDNLEVRGFDTALSVSHTEYSVTLHDVQILAPRRVGLRNAGNVVALRNVAIEDAPIALQNTQATGLIAADGLRVQSRSVSQIDNRGYFVAVRAQLPAAFSAEAAFAFLGTQRLPLTPRWALTSRSVSMTSEPTKSWVNAARYGAVPDSGQDATQALQAAIDSGAATIYLPSGRYPISNALRLPATLRRVVGMGSVLAVAKRSQWLPRERGLLRVETAGPTLSIEHLTLDNTDGGPQVGIEHSGARTLVLRDFVAAGARTQRTEAGGRLRMENTCCSPLSVSGKQPVEALQLNTEGRITRIHNDGAPLSILGLKVEQPCTVLDTRHGGTSEVVGGLVYPVHPDANMPPAFTLDATSQLAISYAESAYRPGAVYQHHFTRAGAAGAQEDVRADTLPRRGGLARMVPFLALPAGGQAPSVPRPSGVLP